MTSYLDKEMHHLPWDSAYSGITYIKNMFITSGKFEDLRVRSTVYIIIFEVTHLKHNFNIC